MEVKEKILKTINDAHRKAEKEKLPPLHEDLTKESLMDQVLGNNPTEDEQKKFNQALAKLIKEGKITEHMSIITTYPLKLKQSQMGINFYHISMWAYILSSATLLILQWLGILDPLTILSMILGVIMFAFMNFIVVVLLAIIGQTLPFVRLLYSYMWERSLSILFFILATIVAFLVTTELGSALTVGVFIGSLMPTVSALLSNKKPENMEEKKNL